MEAAQVESDVGRAVGLLGGEKAIHARVRNAMDAHEVLLKGLPADALLHLVSAVTFLERGDALKKAIGLSLRTLQRHKAKSAPQLLSVEQSNRAWRFAEIFAHAIDVMGSEEAAEIWMNKPAIGLSNRKPVDLLATSAGVEAVEEYLTRLEYGVYA
ncbi:antitoxin Xre/MbcA/ParS toxin-binding domain-containing protein [Labrenzia sp. OB1]|uniref:type II RES/Xre toxin-antitoxin system antitoxin n=1 Tax=Labrenzia sp. OB1 TaxID=1561204 RepID=UPI0007B1F32E|nr:antitoxin Xre/MbcA/ParS toxin-binding domain-containing protein [Labrenzia sp. OB1]KZM47723.1 antitoxin [Labrenzia sp. OB1]